MSYQHQTDPEFQMSKVMVTWRPSRMHLLWPWDCTWY